MLTRREEDIVIMENEEKNTELLMEWVKGKEDKRDGTDRGQGNYRDGGREEREITGGV
jgi:hypothetical protein